MTLLDPSSPWGDEDEVQFLARGLARALTGQGRWTAGDWERLSSITDRPAELHPAVGPAGGPSR